MLLGGAWLPIDHAGRRTSITTPLGGTTYFHYAGELLVAESDRRGNVTATYAWSPEGGLISTTRGGETYYYQTNAHGDVVSLTDSAGRVVNTYSYDPWGQILMASERVENPFRYGSCYYDTSTGLYYLWQRYYDPGLKRFLSKDPVLGSVCDPASFNPYAYAANNPMSVVEQYEETGKNRYLVDGLLVSSWAPDTWTQTGTASSLRAGLCPGFLHNGWCGTNMSLGDGFFDLCWVHSSRACAASSSWPGAHRRRHPG
jgi:RHS repeat-associated protein